MEVLSQLAQVGTISLLAAMSPGPDFAMVSRNALGFSRKAGLLSALGLGMGIIFHVTLCLSGLAIVMSQFPMLFKIIQRAGALYLLWIGFQALRSGRSAIVESASGLPGRIPAGEAFRMGFFTNALNPKATLFIFSLYTQFIDPFTPVGMQVVLGIEVAVVTFAWFAFISVFLSHPWVKACLGKIQQNINIVLGLILMGWGTYLLGA